jgi:hypothetical protein
MSGIFFNRMSIVLILLVNSNYTFSQNLDSLKVVNQTLVKDGYEIVISPDFFSTDNDEEIASLYYGFMQISPNEDKWIEKVIGVDDYNLSNIIRNNYRIYFDGAKGFNQTYKLLENSIVESSNLKDKNKLKLGDTLLLPPLPVKINSWVDNNDLVQYFRYEKDSVYRAVDETVKNSNEYDYLNKDFLVADAKSASRIYASVESFDKAERLNQFSFRHISIEDKMKHFLIRESNDFPDSLKILEIEFFNMNTLNNNASEEYIVINEPSQETIQKVGNIDEKFIKNYLILDAFNNKDSECSHGEEVFSVSYEILEKLNAHKFYKKIVKVPIDFFSNRKSAIENVIEYYGHKDTGRFEADLKSDLKFFRSIKQGKCRTGFCVPEKYLRYLIELKLHYKPEVISMSFSFKPRLPVLGFFVNNLKETSLVAAVENTRSSIESYLNSGESGDIKKEPMYTFSEGEDKILVGAQNKTGNYDCFYSINGSKVSAIGYGEWFYDDVCVPQIYGSSYATPQIATYLWIMKSYFQSLNRPLSPSESKFRLLLSSDINPNFVGKFASGGVPNINRMLISHDSYACISERNLKVKLIEDTSSYNLVYKDERGRLESLYFTRDVRSGFSGIVIIEEKVFIFQKDYMKWERIEKNKIESINLKFETENGVSYHLKSVKDFQTNNITQLITFK